jgi:hypothetical protein
VQVQRNAVVDVPVAAVRRSIVLNLVRQMPRRSSACVVLDGHGVRADAFRRFAADAHASPAASIDEVVADVQVCALRELQ